MSLNRAQMSNVLTASFMLVLVAPGVHAQTYRLVYSFQGGADGQNPAAALRSDSAGNLYGTTYGGGAKGLGTVFRIAPDGTETVLYSFKAGGGYHPESRVTTGHTMGKLYGTTASGGTSGWGTIWRQTPGGNQAVLHSFKADTDGSGPFGGLVRHLGSLYGITPSDGPHRYGTAFKLDPDGTFTVLHAFGGRHDGANPSEGPIGDRDGNLYGTTEIGGASGYGTVYEIAPGGTEAVLYSFTGKKDGSFPAGGLARDESGNLYGTSQGPGAYGSVFRLAPEGKFTVLHTFVSGEDGADPRGAVLNIDGNIYGTTSAGGGGCHCGTVYKVAPDGTETILHSFAGPPDDGESPTVGLARGKGHTLYGTTYSGGEHNLGTVFSITEQ